MPSSWKIRAQRNIFGIEWQDSDSSYPAWDAYTSLLWSHIEWDEINKASSTDNWTPVLKGWPDISATWATHSDVWQEDFQSAFNKASSTDNWTPFIGGVKWPDASSTWAANNTSWFDRGLGWTNITNTKGIIGVEA